MALAVNFDTYTYSSSVEDREIQKKGAADPAPAPAPLTPSTPESGAAPGDPMAALIQMMAILIAMEVLVGNIMGKNSELQDKMNLDQYSAVQTKMNIMKEQIERAEEEARSAGIFQKIAMAFECAVAVLTFPIDPVGSSMMMVGIVIQTLETQGIIPQQWGSSPVGSFFAKMAVVVALTVCGNVLAAPEKAGAEAGDEAGAGAAAAAPSDAARVARAFSPSMLTAQSLATLNPLSDLANCASGKTKEILSIVLTVVTVLLAAAAAYYGAQNGTLKSNLLKGRLSEESLNQWSSRIINITALCGLVEAGAGIGAGVFQIKQGQTMIETAQVEKEITILNAVAQIVKEQTDNYNQWEDGINKEFSQLNGLFNQFTSAEMEAARVLQG